MTTSSLLELCFYVASTRNRIISNLTVVVCVHVGGIVDSYFCMSARVFGSNQNWEAQNERKIPINTSLFIMLFVLFLCF